VTDDRYLVAIDAPTGKVSAWVDGDVATALVRALATAVVSSIDSQASDAPPSRTVDPPLPPGRVRRSPQPRPFICEYCGEPFLAKNARAKVCKKPECRRSYWRDVSAKRRERAKERRERAKERRDEQPESLPGQTSIDDPPNDNGNGDFEVTVVAGEGVTKGAP